MNIKAKFMSMLTVCLVISLFPAAPAMQIASAASLEKPYYIMDEGFSFMLDYNKPSGWDIKAAGGKVTAGYCSTFKIADNSDMLPVSMNKPFSAEKTGKLTLEYRFNFITPFSSVEWQLRSDDTAGLSIIVKDNNLCLEAGKEVKVLTPVLKNVEYGIKAIVDIDNKKTDVYVNGELKAQGADFKNAVSSINNFQVKTGVEAKGEMIFTPVKLYKGYVINERLISTIRGQFPSDWQSVKTGGTISIAEMLCSTQPDIYSFKMDDTSNTEVVGVSKTFEPQGGPLVFEYKQYFVKKADGVSAEIFSGSDKVFSIVTDNGSICYIGADGKPVAVNKYIENLWYNIKVKIDPDTSKAELYINGKLVKKDLSLLAKSAGISKVSFSTGKTSVGTIWLDDILVYGNPPLPADYVAAPVIPTKADPSILVAMQSCSMWRDGTHLGWDSISGFPDRTPYLGFYDEGNSEIADWEIKWLAEHGVDYQMFFFFRPNGSQGNPVKDPFLASALLDGYFNAQYSDKMKFSISWENGSASSMVNSSDDFRKNIVPFWIEYYFKDPRYLKIDNKPVLTIYSMTGLKRDLGDSLEKIKAETDYLRQACKDAGFDGAIILNSNSGGDPKANADIKAAGFDSIYTYSWGYASGMVATQKAGLLKEQKAGGMDFIPTIAMGRDDTAWGRAIGQGSYAKPEDFKELCKWTKDVFMPSLPEGSMGKKMITLDNWNEFGEGHFLMPSGLNGFGYIDAIRDVFTTGGPHEDLRPSAAVLERTSKLFLDGRTVPTNYKVLTAAVPTDVAKGWYFDKAGDTEGWTVEKQIDGLGVKDGAISGTANDVDAAIITPDNMSMDIDNISHVRVRLKNDSPSSEAQIYFTTEKDGKWGEDKCVRFMPSPNSTEFKDYDIYMLNNVNWKGKLRQFRIDPLVTKGNFAIDKIEFLGAPGGAAIKVKIDGVLQRYEQPPIIINSRTMAPLRAIFEALGAAIEWDGTTKTVTAFKSGTVIQLTIGDVKAYINKKLTTLDQAPAIVNDRTLVPVRFISEALGAKVDWDAANNTVVITYNGVAAAPGTVSVPTGPNLVKDPSMEGTKYAYSTWSATPTFDKAEFHTGKQALKVVGTAQFGSLQFALPIEAGKEYYYSAWAKLAPDTKATVIAVVISYTLDGAKVQKIMFSSPVLSKTAWTQFSGTYRIDKSEKIVDPTLVMFLDKPSGVDTFFIDDVEVKTTSAEGTGTATTTTPTTTTPAATTTTPAATTTTPAGVNLIKDPGMETAKFTGTNWSATPTFVKTSPHAGSQCLQVVATAPFGCVKFTPTVELQAGKEYYYSAWVKLAPDSTSTVVRMIANYVVDGAVVQKYAATSPKLTPGEWTQMTGTFTIDAGLKVTGTLVSMFADLPNAAGTFFVDDIEVKAVN